MNAPFPLNPQVGEWSQNWVWNGARWVASPTTGLRILTRVFTDSGPYMPSPGLVSCAVECIGGGGAGGVALATNDPQHVWTGGGGASGGYSRATFPAALVRGGVLVTVGAGGVSGAQGAGENGTATSFGALCMANGGGGGGNSDAGSYGGGAGAVGIGDVVFRGACGMPGPMMDVPTSEFIGGVGGVGGEMFGGNAAINTGKGSANQGYEGAPNSGAGGQGGAINQNATAGDTLGGDGGSGVCIVTEYVVGDRDQPQPPQWRPPLDVNVSVQPPRPPWPGGQPGPVPPWPPGSPWWPWWPWPPGQAPHPPLPGPREFEAEQQSFQPWDDQDASDS